MLCFLRETHWALVNTIKESFTFNIVSIVWYFKLYIQLCILPCVLKFTAGFCDHYCKTYIAFWNWMICLIHPVYEHVQCLTSTIKLGSILSVFWFLRWWIILYRSRSTTYQILVDSDLQNLGNLHEPFMLFPVVVHPVIPRCGWMVEELGILRCFTHQVWKEFSHRWRCNLNTARLSFPFPNTCLMRNVRMRADFSTHICFPSMTDEVWRQARQKTGAAAAWKDSPLESFLCIQVPCACVL